MFKTFFQTTKQLEQNLQSLLKHQQIRFFSKPKKVKKMYRSWEFTHEGAIYQQQNQSKSAARKYRLISYNILAQDLLVEHIFLYYGIETQHLRWDHRLRCLQNELTFLNADILCIQEMQFNHLKEFVRLLSCKRKMEYIYKKKTGHRTDGCAIIYDREIFQLKDHRDVEFYQPKANSHLTRENVALLAKFKLCHEPDKEIVVGTTHLLFNPRRHDVRVAQVELLLEYLTNFAQKCVDNKSTYLPIILTGDMNSEPNSPPFRTLTSLIPNQCSIKNTEDNETTPSESFILKAVNFGRNCASTWHDHWITVDYVLHSMRIIEENEQKAETDSETTTARDSAMAVTWKSDIKVLSIYKLPSVDNCEFMGKIPNKFLGSDHYLQAVEFLVT